MKYLSFLLIFLVLSCTKEKDPSREEPVPIVSDPIKREKGTVLGDGVAIPMTNFLKSLPLDFYLKVKFLRSLSR